MTNAGFVNFYAQVILPAMFCRLFNQRLTVAETDLKHSWRHAPKCHREIQRCRRVFDAVIRPQSVQRPLLSRRQPAGTPNETAHTAMRRLSVD